MTINRRHLNRLLAQRIRKAREASQNPATGQPYSQRALAELVGTSNTTISNVESERQLVPIDLIYRIAIGLRVALDELLPEPNEVERSTEQASDPAEKPLPKEWEQHLQ